jgi:hypothetical protein
MRGAALRIGRSFASFKEFAVLGLACLLGIAAAAVAIGLAPESTIDPGLRPLASQSATRLAPLSSVDVNCRYAVRAAPGLSGTQQVRELVCDD